MTEDSLLRTEALLLVQQALDYIEGVERVWSVKRESSEDLRAQIMRVADVAYRS